MREDRPDNQVFWQARRVVVSSGAGFLARLWSRNSIPALIRKCLEPKQRGDEHIVVWGTGIPTREFLYVEDAAEGILLPTERYNKSEPVNLGIAFEVSIKDLVKLIVQLTGFA